MRLNKILFLYCFVFFTAVGCKKESADIPKQDTIIEKPIITAPKSNGDIIKHNYFSLSYVELHEQAEWVFYNLTPVMINGTINRTDDFRPDLDVSTGSSELTDYVGSGYDRGHLCPAADMTHTEEAMSETFLLSNISPQNSSFNRGNWAKLESIVRKNAIIESELYVVTGPVFIGNKGMIGTNNVTIPGHFYKVLYSPKNEKMIGFIMPNENSTNDIKSFVVTVDSVENATDIDFFPQLTTDWEHKLEGKVDINKWSFETFTKPTDPINEPVVNPDPEPNPSDIPSDCPTTSNCGCSNKKKSVCETDPCCKWIVGTGCKCKD